MTPADWQADRDRRRRPSDVARSRSTSTPTTSAARGDPRLLGQRGRRRAVPALAGRRHSHRHAQQEGQQRPAGALHARPWRRAAPAGSHYLYEATVGAGLPIIVTLRDLRETGDEIRRIEGIFSGTLAYLFNVWDGTQPFSAIVRDAKAKGFTEPDPRDDLSGMDVARKLVILGARDGAEARAVGRRARGADSAAAGGVPRRTSSWSACGELDAPMLARLERRAGGEPRAALRGRARRRRRARPGRPGASWSARTRSPTST